MQKVYTTQLFGLFKAINDKQEEQLEDAARFLAQAIVSKGTIYIRGFDQLKALEEATTNGYDALPHAKILDGHAMDVQDRLLIFAQNSSDERVVELLKSCSKTGTPTIVVSSSHASSTSELENGDIFLDTGVKGGLVPDDSGKRIGHPGTIAALFMYNQLYLILMDILSELDE